MEEKERAEKAKKIKEQFDDPNQQWEKDKTDLEALAKEAEAKEAEAAEEAEARVTQAKEAPDKDEKLAYKEEKQMAKPKAGSRRKARGGKAKAIEKEAGEK